MNEHFRGIPRKLVEEGVKSPDFASEFQKHEVRLWQELLLLLSAQEKLKKEKRFWINQNDKGQNATNSALSYFFASL